MCGIVGFTDYEKKIGFKTPILKDMCAQIIHRGPDDEGAFADEIAGIAMRRLAIIDINTGHQPIHNEDKSIWLVFNGEIYNYIELRDELLKRGHVFYTDSDSEVIIHAYEEYGESFVEKLVGMFGIAIWDTNKQELILIRDRAGIKPLYYFAKNSTVVFASEIKCLFKHPDIKPDVNKEKIDEYFSLGYVLAPNTLFTGIKKLRPGHMLKVNKREIKEIRYWDMPVESTEYYDEIEALEVFNQKLDESIRIRLRSDVPFGAFLSGGIDSSLVVAKMAENIRTVKTFSIGFEEEEYNELKYAKRVSNILGTEHEEFIVRPDAIEMVDKIVWHFDEPFGDSSAIPTFYVSKMARKHVKMTLSGDGGDELFAGYTRYIKYEKLRKYAKLPNVILKNGLNLLKSVAIGEKNRRKLEWYKSRLTVDPFAMYMMGVGLTQDHLKRELYSEELLKHTTFNYDFPELKIYSFKNNYSLEKLFKLDFNTYLVEDILKKVDRMSMANSLEARVPLLDHRLVEFAYKVDRSLKIKDGKGKYLMRKTLSKYIPDELINRPKKGFSIPIAKWFRDDLKELALDMLGSQDFKQRGYFNQSGVDKLMDDHIKGYSDHSESLWLLLNYELWYRKFIRS